MIRQQKNHSFLHLFSQQFKTWLIDRLFRPNCQKVAAASSVLEKKYFSKLFFLWKLFISFKVISSLKVGVLCSDLIWTTTYVEGISQGLVFFFSFSLKKNFNWGNFHVLLGNSWVLWCFHYITLTLTVYFQIFQRWKNIFLL